jgi:dienelactone hydrolase
MSIRRTVPVRIPVSGIDLALSGDLTSSEADTGLVIFAHGSGSSRMSPRNRAVAAALAQAGLATLLLDLLTEPEAANRANVFDIPLLAARVAGAVDWACAEPRHAGRRIGLFGASTGAAAALVAAADRREDVGAVVSRGGRPDLAGDALELVVAPTLLIVGGADHAVIGLNEEAYARLRCEKRLAIVPGATHLFEEPGTLEAVTGLAADWFTFHLARSL